MIYIEHNAKINLCNFFHYDYNGNMKRRGSHCDSINSRIRE